MSPVTYFEIALTKDPRRRVELLGFAQHLLHDQLLASPEEMIVGFLYRGCPLLDPIKEWQSRMPLSDAWNRIANRSDITFELNQESVQQGAKAHRFLGSIAEKILNSRSINPENWTEAEHFQLIIELAKTKLPRRERLKFIPDDVHEAQETLTIFYIFAMFCRLNTLNPIPYIEFWNHHRINSPLSRMKRLIENHPILFFRGPFLAMAFASVAQFRAKPTRDLIFDIMHFSYLPWIKLFITEDPHYASARTLGWHPHGHKIILRNGITTGHEWHYTTFGLPDYMETDKKGHIKP